MARGRKSERVKVLTSRDTTLLRQLDRTGIASLEQAKNYCGLSESRIGKLEKSGYIKTTNHIVDGKSTKIIQLDRAGKTFCRQTYGTKMFATAQTNHLTHDLRLTEAYYHLKPEIRETWKHERELIISIYNNNHEMKNGGLKTCVDATVLINNEIVAIEAIGKSYTNAILVEKQEIATNYLQCVKMFTF